MAKLITCFHTGKTGKLISHLGNKGQGTNLLCEDVTTGERFVVLKRKPVPRQTGRKAVKRKHLRKGQRVLLQVLEVDKPVPAIYQGVRSGRTQFLGVDDPVWSGCVLHAPEAKVVEVLP